MIILGIVTTTGAFTEIAISDADFHTVIPVIENSDNVKSYTVCQARAIPQEAFAVQGFQKWKSPA